MKMALIGISAGIISGLFASGGGLILVPIYTYIMGFEDKKARATSVFCILPMVLVTAFVYSRNNFIDWQIGIKCAVGGIVGGFIGSKLLNIIPEKYLKISFIIFLLYAGFKMLF